MLTFASGATTAQTIQLTVAVASTVSSLRTGAPVMWAMIGPLGLLAFLPLIGRDRRRLRRALGTYALVFLLAGLIAGCSGSSPAPMAKLPPAGKQTITVTASGSSPSGNVSHQLQLTITVTN